MTASFILLAAFLASRVSCIRLWASPGELPTTIPAACRASLVTDIQCSPRFVRGAEVISLGSLEEDFLAEYCTTTCTDSIEAFAQDVNARCGDTQRDWGFNITRSGNDVARPLLWTHTVACLTDKDTGEFCAPAIANGTVEECDDCTLRYLSHFINVGDAPDIIDEELFEEMVSSCSAAATDYPFPTSTQPGLSQPTVTNLPGRECLMGTNYTVSSDDTCESIAEANNLAIDRFLGENGIDFHCETLHDLETVCVGDSCKLHTVAEGETCADIMQGQGFTLTELTSWNPVIYARCENIDALVGRTICISPPGTDDWDVDVSVSWKDDWSTPSGSWVDAPTHGVDADDDSFPAFPTIIPTMTGTANASRASEFAQYDMYCPITDEDLDLGFEWSMLNEECQEMLEPHCSPYPSGDPPESTTFPSSCMPAAHIVTSVG